MDAFELISERKRMCRSFGNSCRNCPAIKDGWCMALRFNEETVRIIYKWSKENPYKAQHSRPNTGKEDSNDAVE